jgi:hypothetical protein
MGRGKKRWTRLIGLTLTVVLIAQPWTGRVQAQMPGTIPGMGSMNTAATQPVSSAGTGGQTSDSSSPSTPDYDSAVSFIDSAIPMTQVKLLIDANYGDHQPSRAAYLFPKSGVPGSPGWQTPETNVDWQELTSYIEIAYQNVFSGFLVLPTIFVNPEVNANNWGMADIQAGLKAALLSSPGFTTSVEIRGTIPTRSGPGLSTDHYSVEPGLLMFLRPMEALALEGELRYWIPINGTDFAGQIARYGLGLSLGQSSYQSVWVTPVVEVIGWTVTSGKEMAPTPDGFTIHSAAGETIVNGMAGLRFGFGDNGDIYVGYGHSLTGDAWQRDLWRVEFRVRF